MHLCKHDLFQMNDEWLKKLPAELLLEVSKRLLHDVKELQDRLNQNPDNSSCPPTSQAPWANKSGAADEGGRELGGREQSRRRDGDGKLDGRDGTGSAGRWPAVIDPNGVWEAARQTAGQSRSWSQSEAGDHRPE